MHTHRDSKKGALPWSWYLDLPHHVADPRAVLLDKTDPKGALLMVFDVEGKSGKLVVKIDYDIESRGAGGFKIKKKANILLSGKIIDPATLRDTVSYELLEWSL